MRDEEDLGKRWERAREEIRSIQKGLGRGEGWGEGKDKSWRERMKMLGEEGDEEDRRREKANGEGGDEKLKKG
jgi:hypothetical protein